MLAHGGDALFTDTCQGSGEGAFLYVTGQPLLGLEHPAGQLGDLHTPDVAPVGHLDYVALVELVPELFGPHAGADGVETGVHEGVVAATDSLSLGTDVR